MLFAENGMFIQETQCYRNVATDVPLDLFIVPVLLFRVKGVCKIVRAVELYFPPLVCVF